METCKLCKHNELKEARERLMTICAQCATALGASPMPSPRRPPVPCARCGGRRFVRAIPRTTNIRSTAFTRAVSEKPVTEAVTYTINTRGTQVGVAWIPDVRLDLAAPHGVIARYICTGCGFVEKYCDDPEQILIGPEHMTDIVEYDEGGPYR